MVKLKPLHGEFGGEVYGAQIPYLVEHFFPEIEDALYKYGLVLFRGQRLEPEDQIQFMKRIAEVRQPHGVERTLPGHPGIAVLGNIMENGVPLGFQHDTGIEWHTDGTGWKRATIATCLYCLEAPNHGGDTLFCSGYNNIKVLPDELMQRVNGLNLVYSRPLLIERISKNSNNPREMTSAERVRFPDVIRPLISIHPVTDKPAMVMSIEECREFEGMNENDSRKLLEEILAVITESKNIYRHLWRKGDFLIWDNRCIMHSPTPYTYEKEKRHLHRVIGLEPE